jgi:hypothetical protein
VARLVVVASASSAGPPHHLWGGPALFVGRYGEGVDDVAWGALTITLTALGAVWTAYAFRRRGVASGLRGLGITLVPLGLLLTHSLRMVTRIVDAVGDWVGGLVWSPMTWIGLIVLGLAVVCFVVSGLVRSRQLGSGSPSAPAVRAKPAGGKAAAPAPVDDDLADIEALLRKRGIS